MMRFHHPACILAPAGTMACHSGCLRIPASLLAYAYVIPGLSAKTCDPNYLLVSFLHQTDLGQKIKLLDYKLVELNMFTTYNRKSLIG